MSKNNNYGGMSLAEVLASRIKDSKERKMNQLIMLSSKRHAIYMINYHPFNIVAALVYYSENDQSVDLSSDNVIYTVGVRQNDTDKIIESRMKELVEVYDNIYSHEEALMNQWRKS